MLFISNTRQQVTWRTTFKLALSLWSFVMLKCPRLWKFWERKFANLTFLCKELLVVLSPGEYKVWQQWRCKEISSHLFPIPLATLLLIHPISAFARHSILLPYWSKGFIKPVWFCWEITMTFFSSWPGYRHPLPTPSHTLPWTNCAIHSKQTSHIHVEHLAAETMTAQLLEIHSSLFGCVILNWSVWKVF